MASLGEAVLLARPGSLLGCVKFPFPVIPRVWSLREKKTRQTSDCSCPNSHLFAEPAKGQVSLSRILSAAHERVPRTASPSPGHTPPVVRRRGGCVCGRGWGVRGQAPRPATSGEISHGKCTEREPKKVARNFQCEVTWPGRKGGWLAAAALLIH